jgi:hypothetical protein
LSRRYSGSFKSNLASHASPRAHVRRIEPSSLDRFSPIDRYCSRLETAPSLFRRKPVLLARLLVIARSGCLAAFSITSPSPRTRWPRPKREPPCPIELYFGNSNFLFNRFTEAGGKAYRLQFEAYRL